MFLALGMGEQLGVAGERPAGIVPAARSRILEGVVRAAAAGRREPETIGLAGEHSLRSSAG